MFVENPDTADQVINERLSFYFVQFCNTVWTATLIYGKNNSILATGTLVPPK